MKKQPLQLLCACLAGFAYAANYTNHAPLASMLMKEFGHTKAMAGLLTTGIFASHALMQVPGGHLADKYGGKRVLIWALAIVAIGNFAISRSTGYGQLLFWKVFTGFGTGTCFVAGARYIAQVIPTAKLPMAQGLYGAAVLLGSGFVVFAVPILAKPFGWQGAFMFTGGVAMLVWLLWGSVAPAPELVSHPHVKIRNLLANGQLWLLGIVQMASFGLVIVIGSWVSELLKVKLGLAPVAAGQIGSLVLLTGIFSRFFGGQLVSSLGYRPLLVGSLLANVAGCCLLALDTASLPLAIVAILVIGIGSGLPYAALFNRAVALFPGRGGAAMGLVNMLGIVMILAGAPLVGKLADLSGNFTTAFLSLAAFAALAIGAALAIKKD